MVERTATGLEPLQIFLAAPAGHQWDWTALIIAGAQITVIGFGIWVMHRAFKERGQQIAQQTRQLEQQALDGQRRHEQAMAALHALIERMSPRPPELPAG